MSRPGTRFFIGPLTPAQQRRRERSRENFRRAAEIADARYIPMADAFRIAREGDRYVRRFIDYLHAG